MERPDLPPALESYARTSFDEGYDDIESLAGVLEEYAEEQGLDVAEDDLGWLAAHVVVEAQAEELVRAGYHDRARMISALEDVVESADADYDEADIARTVDRLAAAKLEEQRDWPEVTDYDRLNRAFAQLNESGIVARENFTCCQSCGVSEIGDEIPEGAAADGFTFFHQQDTDGVVASGLLYLSFGTFTPEPDKEQAVLVGRRVTEALSAQGLDVTWDGTSARRISVDMNWQRR